MKTQKLEKLLLLEQTGELSPRRRRLLDGCPEAHAKRAELNALYAALPVLDAEPSPWTVIRIDARLHAERRPNLIFSRVARLRSQAAGNVWLARRSPLGAGGKLALSLAACLMVAGGILNFHGKQTSSASVLVVVAAAEVDVWNDPLEEDLSRLENLIMAISGDPLDNIMEM